jgi:hypothetical protein
MSERADAPHLSTPPRVSPRSWLILALIVAIFLGMRLPVMLHQAGGQDESDFAVPGLTILREGIPRIPYMPSRNTEGVFYKADVALFTLPPAYFYWQAIFYAILGPSHAAARIASTAAGLAGLWLVYQLGRRAYRDERIALLGVALYSLSRFFYFPCLFARPDMLCGAIGLGAIACIWSWHRSGRRAALVGAGALVGLGMLTHPSTIVYALQVGVWVLCASRTWRSRFTNPAIVVGVSLAVFALWLPLILAYPEEFRVQFFNNVLDRSGPGLLSRLVWPFEPLRYQSVLLWEHAGPWQLALVAFGVLVATVHDLPRSISQRWSAPALLVVLAWTSSYLLIACQGVHPTKGYWCYPAAFLFLLVARASLIMLDALQQRFKMQKLVVTASVVLLALIMLPGSGVRTTVAYVTHWSDPDYDSRRFVAGMLHDLPPDAIYAVDPAHVFEFYIADRTTLAAETTPFSFDVRQHRFDYLVASRYDFDRDVPGQLGAIRLREYGDPSDIFACHAIVYRAEDARR